MKLLTLKDGDLESADISFFLCLDFIVSTAIAVFMALFSNFLDFFPLPLNACK